jgi:hypothetical protein
MNTHGFTSNPIQEWPKPSSTDPEVLEWEKLSRDEALMLHQSMRDQLATLKEKELKFRKFIVDKLFPNKTEGMNTLDLGNGYQAKAGVKYNYNCSDYPTVVNGLKKIAALGNEGSFVAERLVSFTPNFLLTEYRKLQDDAEKGSLFAKQVLAIIPEFLTITDAAPTFEIKEPGKKKK